MTKIATFEGLTMGGSWRVRLSWAWLGDREQSIGALIQERLDLVDAQMSAWKPDSDLCRLNRAPIGDWVDVPTEMATVIAFGLAAMDRFPGTFSILLGGASSRWGFAPGTSRPVSADRAGLELEGRRARRMDDISVDLNALAKGFAADLAGAALRDLDCPAYLIEVAGDIVVHGRRPDDLPWTVALELPLPDRSVPIRLLPMPAAGALATSGGYRRNNASGTHLIDPVTGTPLGERGSTCVFAATGIEAEVLATALYVAGADQGLGLAERDGVEVIFVEPDPPDGFVERGSTLARQRLHGSAAMS